MGQQEGDAQGTQVDEPRLRQMLAHLPAYAVMIDRQLRYLWTNRLDPSLSEEQVMGHTIDEFVHPDFLPMVVGEIERAFETGEHRHYETRGYAEGAVDSWYRTTVVPLPAEAPGDACALLLSSDITKQYQAESALRESEQRFRLLTECSPDVIVIVDGAQRITYLNRDPGGRSGVLGRQVADLAHPDDAPQAEAAVQRCLETGESTHYEAWGTAPPPRLYSCRVVRLTGGGPDRPTALIVSTDVTDARRAERERMELEAQLQQAQKIETIGRLTGGIAHDFNNILLVIQSQLDFAQDALDNGDDPRDELAAIRTATEKASDTIRGLLAFGRRQSAKRAQLDLNSMVRDMHPLIRRALPATVELDLALDAEPVCVQGDRSQLEQVLLNLCINARDAIEGAGRVSISVARDGALARLRVSDTGCGMSEAVAAQAFDPFFTTKAPGQGSGLGLSMVHGIVAQHDGRVELDTVQGKGTTIDLLLPVFDGDTVEPSGARPPARPDGREARADRPATILLADDERAVRDVLTLILERAGYRVLPASDGREAVERFREHADEIDLVLLDAVMPDLSGKDAFERIHALRPDVRVLFSSGYAADALPADFAEAHGLRVVPKPYRPRKLLAIIDELLHS